MLDGLPRRRPNLLLEAASLMTSALALLDEADAPADIGAHLDLAVCRLKRYLQSGDLAGAPIRD